MCHVALVSHIDNGLRDGPVIQFLRSSISFRPGLPPVWRMPDVLQVLLDRADHIPLHDLHVVDVIKQFEVRRSLLACTNSTPHFVWSHM